MKTINLATKTGLESIDREGKSFERGSIYSIEHLIKKGEVAQNYGKDPVFAVKTDEWRWWSQRDGIVFQVRADAYGVPKDFAKFARKAKEKDFIPTLILTPAQNKRQAYFVVFNADGEGHEPNWIFENDVENIEGVSLSLECLRRFYDKATLLSVAKRLASDSIEIIDYTADLRIDLTAAEKKIYDKWTANGLSQNPCRLTPPQAGYTLVGCRWHRSATVLLYDWDHGFSIIMGQDEDTYFGCELPHVQINTIEQAYKILTPKIALKTAGVKRQGEWFLVPVAVPPALSECIFEGSTEAHSDGIGDNDRETFRGDAWLGRDDEESSRHYIQSNDLRIRKDGVVFAENPWLYHSKSDHIPINVNGWVEFHRNTALRSFSVEGVD